MARKEADAAAGHFQTEFERALNEAADAQMELSRLEQHAALSAESFTAAALRAANADIKRIDAVRAIIDAKPEFEAVATARRQLIKMIRSGHVKSMPRGVKVMRILRLAAGVPDLLAECSEMGIKAMEVFAVAVADLAAAHPDCFGTLSSWDEYEDKIAELRERYAAALKRLEVRWSAADVVRVDIERPGDGPANRVLVAETRFKRARHLGPDQRDWPSNLVQYVLAVSGGDAEPLYRPTMFRVHARRAAALDAAAAAAQEIDEARLGAHRQGGYTFSAFVECQQHGQLQWWLAQRRAKTPSSDIAAEWREAHSSGNAVNFIEADRGRLVAARSF